MTDIQMVKGDTTIFDVHVTRFNPTTGLDENVPLTGAKAWFTAKKESTDLDASAVIAKNSVDHPSQVGITVSTAMVRVTIIPTDTVNYPSKWLNYDVQVREADGTITTVQKGKLELLKQATVASV
jgi:hypothetical protein